MHFFIVIYVGWHLISATYVGQGVTTQQCSNAGAELSRALEHSDLVKNGTLKMSDVRVTCELHSSDPTINANES